MNEKFFSLPREKQQSIINAGFRVFSQNSYRKSPMSEIADAAGISKSLLFHYFRNKKELYLFLLELSAKITIEALEKNDCYYQEDLFESLFRGMRVKAEVMRQYPELGFFAVKAFYEKDPELAPELQECIMKYASFRSNARLLNLDPERFRPGLDLEMMYWEMYWASEGYIWEKLQQGDLDIDAMEEDFMKLIAFWKSIYLRREE